MATFSERATHSVTVCSRVDMALTISNCIFHLSFILVSVARFLVLIIPVPGHC